MHHVIEKFHVICPMKSIDLQRQFLWRIKECGKTKDLRAGKALHQDVILAALHTNLYVSAALVRMYSKCQSMALAQLVFDSMPTHDVVSWNSLIFGYVENGECSLALSLFVCMDCEPDPLTYVAALKACGGFEARNESLQLRRGIAVHERIKRSSLCSSSAVGTALIEMYSKCGSLRRAYEAFQVIPNQDVVSWTSLMLGCLENGESWACIDLFQSMDCAPDSFAFVAVLKAFGLLANSADAVKPFCLEKGISLHKDIRSRHLHSNIVVGTTLLDMYAKCGSIRHAKKVFDGMLQQNIVTWNSIISGYVENRNSLIALDLFHNLSFDSPNLITFVAATKACGCLANERPAMGMFCLEKGIAIHKRLKQAALDSTLALANSLIDMYSKCGSMFHAKVVFESMKLRDVVSWTSLILGYVLNGQVLNALEEFKLMDCTPSSVTFVALLKGLGALGSEDDGEGKDALLQRGMDIHQEIIRLQLDSDTVLLNTLIDMYCKCGGVEHARDIFDGMSTKNSATWTSLMLGYIENGDSLVALDLFAKMDCKPDSVTYIATIKACAALACSSELDKKGSLEKGMAIHKEMVDKCFDFNTVLSNALIDMYSKCGDMRLAKDVFDTMRNRDVVSWTSFIQGYLGNQEYSRALSVFSSMDCQPDPFTYAAVLKACGGLGKSERKIYLEKGIAIHKELKGYGYESDVILATTLLDMYAKCGSMRRARDVYDQMVDPPEVALNCLLLGYVENGESQIALELHRSESFKPSPMTYVCMLKACGSLACEDESMSPFWLVKGMSIHKEIIAAGCHLDKIVANSLLDMYGKCGRMKIAKSTFDAMFSRDVISWTSLIFGYVEHGDYAVALELFFGMDCQPNSVTHACILKACAVWAMKDESKKSFCLEKGIGVHNQIRKHGNEFDIVICNALVDMYSKCGSMEDAKDTFDKMVDRNVISWTSLIMGYVINRESSLAVDLFFSMDCTPDSLTFMAILKACVNLSAMTIGQQVHGALCELGYEGEQTLANTLMCLYVKCGCMTKAGELFDKMQTPDIVSWNTLLSGYTYFGDSSQVFSLLKVMQEAGIQMDTITCTCILVACSHAGRPMEGKLFFDSIEKYGVYASLEHYNCMLDILGRSNRLHEALTFFHAISCEGNDVTWMTILGACQKWGNLQVGKVAFGHVLDMYAKRH